MINLLILILIVTLFYFFMYLIINKKISYLKSLFFKIDKVDSQDIENELDTLYYKSSASNHWVDTKELLDNYSIFFNDNHKALLTTINSSNSISLLNIADLNIEAINMLKNHLEQLNAKDILFSKMIHKISNLLSINVKR